MGPKVMADVLRNAGDIGCEAILQLLSHPLVELLVGNGVGGA